MKQQLHGTGYKCYFFKKESNFRVTACDLLQINLVERYFKAPMSNLTFSASYSFR